MVVEDKIIRWQKSLRWVGRYYDFKKSDLKYLQGASNLPQNFQFFLKFIQICPYKSFLNILSKLPPATTNLKILVA